MHEAPSPSSSPIKLQRAPRLDEFPALCLWDDRVQKEHVADVLVGVIKQIGVRQIFGLIGDLLNPLADGGAAERLEWIGVRHEAGAALAAAGQAKLDGGSRVCAGTTGPGSNHLVAGLYEAARDHAPVLALSGDMPRKMHGTDYIQTEPILLFRDVSLYTETVASPAQAPAVIHQAIAAAFAELWRCRRMSSPPGRTAASPASRGRSQSPVGSKCGRCRRNRRGCSMPPAAS